MRARVRNGPEGGRLPDASGGLARNPPEDSRPTLAEAAIDKHLADKARGARLLPRTFRGAPGVRGCAGRPEHPAGPRESSARRVREPDSSRGGQTRALTLSAVF